jgi:hypothetical protein
MYPVQLFQSKRDGVHPLKKVTLISRSPMAISTFALNQKLPGCWRRNLKTL